MERSAINANSAAHSQKAEIHRKSNETGLDTEHVEHVGPSYLLTVSICSNNASTVAGVIKTQNICSRSSSQSQEQVPFPTDTLTFEQSICEDIKS